MRADEWGEHRYQSELFGPPEKQCERRLVQGKITRFLLTQRSARRQTAVTTRGAARGDAYGYERNRILDALKRGGSQMFGKIEMKSITIRTWKHARDALHCFNPMARAEYHLALAGSVLFVTLGAVTPPEVIQPCCCYRENQTFACYIPGMGASCGDYSCPHDILTSEPVTRCVTASVGERGKRNCDAHYEVPASLCEMLLKTCQPTSGCASTGIVHRIYYANQRVSGLGCP